VRAPAALRGSLDTPGRRAVGSLDVLDGIFAGGVVGKD
jgi:hypothetical protein